MLKFFLYKIKKALPTDKATRIRTLLATVYAFSAWNLVILTFYYSIQNDIPNTAESKEKFVKKMKEANVDVEFVQLPTIYLGISKDENETNVVET